MSRLYTYNINTSNVEYPPTPSAGQSPNNEFAIQTLPPQLFNNLSQYGGGFKATFIPSIPFLFPPGGSIASAAVAPHSANQQVVQQTAASQAGVSSNSLTANTFFIQPTWEWPIGFNPLQGINSAIPVNGTTATTYVQLPQTYPTSIYRYSYNYVNY